MARLQNPQSIRCCVVTAGLFGAFTVSKRIFFVQAVPAMVALGLIFGGR